MKTTLSIIKADVGGFPGHATVHPDLIKNAEEELHAAKKSGEIKDYFVARCGDDLDLIMTHDKGVDDKKIHELAWNTFISCTEIAKKLKLYGAGQDLLSDTFSGNVKGLGPGSAEMQFEERKSEPILCFLMDKTEPGAFNLPIYKMFGDPFNSAGLVIDSNMHHGFTFEIYDIVENKKVLLNTPEETYDLLALIGGKSRYVIKRIYPREGSPVPKSEAVACISTDKLSKIAGTYVGKDDPVAMVRCQSGLPAVGEALEPWAFPHLVSGWMRGSHNGPLMPCSMEDATPSRFDGPPRVVALGFQIANGTLGRPFDFFKDKAYDRTRNKAIKIADYMRAHGPFEPHRLPSEDMEYTTLPAVMKKLENRFKEI
ncbi:fructose-1,6-bisphosphatase [Candidatus Micrarchaeota archaeon]|nr:fructose-1,6-bisphosphatase [Candidatus Micrarchaeota archaeon]MBU1166636.1 fructose-1,6-bisphosphatase [Candidatus Micrarchaeota archaeon]MBU1886593.1 fructose-1,6-bisphosphatase [Candidatus Micrarchaeota archaeon]